MVDAYDEEEVEGRQRVVLRLHPRLAPVKVAVLPLVNKDGQPEVAHSIYEDLRRRMPAEYDVTYDPDAGTVLIESGPEAGTVVQPSPRVIDAIERAEPGSVVLDTVDRYQDVGEGEGEGKLS